MQHPTGYAVAADGRLHLASVAGYLGNPWALALFAHNQMAPW
jgi:hypothetical protein